MSVEGPGGGHRRSENGGGEEEREREGKMTRERRRTGMDQQQRDAWRVDSGGLGRAGQRWAEKTWIEARVQ